MGSSLTIPASAVDPTSLVAEGERIVEEFANILLKLETAPERGKEYTKHYISIKDQWLYVRNCMSVHPKMTPENLKWFHDMTNKMSTMSSRYITIRRLGLTPIEELEEGLVGQG